MADDLNLFGGPLTVTTLKTGGVDYANVFNGQLTVDTTPGDIFFGGKMTDTGGVLSLSKIGTGTLRLDNANNDYSGGTFIFAGTVKYSASTALGTGTVYLKGGDLAANPGTTTLVNKVSVDVASSYTTPGSDTKLAGEIVGGALLSKFGGGTLIFGNADNSGFTGGITIRAGSIAAAGDKSLGTGTVSTTATTVTLTSPDATSGYAVNLANKFALGGALNIVPKEASQVIQVSGDITGGALGKLTIGTTSSSGTVWLSSATHYTGVTTLQNNNNLKISDDASIGSGSGQLSVVAASTLFVDGNLNVANTVNTGGNLTVDTLGNSVTMAGTIANRGASAGAITKTGSGTLFFDADAGKTRTYSGGTVFAEGTLVASKDTAFGNAAGGLTFTGGTLRITGTSYGSTTRTITLQSGIGTFDIADAGGLFTTTSPIGGSGGLGKSGAGTLSLQSANNYLGGTVVNAGTLIVGNIGALGTGDVTINGGEVQTSFASGTLSNNVLLSDAGAVDVTTGSTTLTGAVSDAPSFAGVLTKIGTGTLVLANAGNSYSGGTQVLGGALSVADDAALGGGALILGGTGDPVTLLVTGATSGTRNITVSDAATISNSADFGIGGMVSGSANLTKAGAGTLTLSGDNSAFSGVFGVGAGTLKLANSLTGGTGGILANGGAIAYADGVNIATPLTLSAPSTQLEVDGTDAATQSGVISETGGAAAVEKIGTGKLTLSGANTFSGGVTVTAGSIYAGSDKALGTGAATLGGGTTLGFASNVALANAVALSGDATIDINGTESNIPGNITGNHGLTILDNDCCGVLTLSGTNSYTGNTTVDGATIRVASDAALGDASSSVLVLNNASLNGAGTFTINRDITANNAFISADSGEKITLAGAIDGSGPLSVFGNFGGTISLTNTGNSYGGYTFVYYGTTLEIAGDGSLGNASNPLYLYSSQLALSGDWTTSRTTYLWFGSATLNDEGHAATVNGTIQEIGGSYGLTKQGGGTLTLNSVNNFSGGLDVESGMVVAGVDGALGTGDVTLADGATLKAGVDGLTIANNLVVQANAETSLDNGGFTLTHSGAIASGSAVSYLGLQGGGVTTLSGDSSTYTGTIGVNGTTTLNLTGTIGGKLTLTGNSTLTGTGTAGDTNVFDTATISPGGSGIGTLTLASLTLNPSAVLKFNLDDPTNPSTSDHITVNGNLTLADASIIVTKGVNFGTGAYDLFDYSGTLSGNLNLGTSTLPTGFFYSLTHTSSLYTLNVTDIPTLFQYWSPNYNGNDLNNIGGDGTWDSSTFGWTETGQEQETWANHIGIFTGPAGTVTVAGTQSFQELDFLTDGYVLKGDGLTGTAQSLIFTDAGVTATINNVIDGTNGLEKDGDGTLVLGGANTYSGGTHLVGGTLSVTSDLALSTGDLTTELGTTLLLGANLANNIAINDFLNVDTTPGDHTLSGNISGSELDVFGTNNLTLSGSNGFGFLYVDAGTVTADFTTGNDPLDGADIELNDGTKLALNVGPGNEIGVGSFIYLLPGAVTVSVDGDNASFVDFFGTFTGPGGLIKDGPGAIGSYNPNTFAGDLTIKQGGFWVTSDEQLGGYDGDGNPTGKIIFDPSTGNTAQLGLYGSFASIRNITLAGNGEIYVSGAEEVALFGAIDGSGQLTKTGGGFLDLLGANSYGGGTVIADGAIYIESDASLGDPAGGITFGDPVAGTNGMLEVGELITSGRAITILTDATLNLFAPLNLTGNITGDAGLSLSKQGPATLALSGDNSGFFGDIIIEEGTLSLLSNTAGGSGSIITHGSVIDYGDGVNSATPIVIGSDTTQLQVLTGTATQSGVISELSGPRPLEKIGTGELDLTAANAFTGTFTVSQGTIGAGNNQALGLGDVVVADGATLKALSGVTIANNVTVNGTSTFDAQGQLLTIDGVVGGPGAVRVIDSSGTPYIGGVVLTGTNTYTGTTTVDTALLEIGAANNISANTLFLTAGGLVTTNSLTLANDVTLSGGGAFVPQTGTALTVNSLITGSGPLIIAGDGTVVLTNAGNTYSGGSITVNGVTHTGGTVITGNTLVITSDAVLGAGNLVFDDVGTLRTNAAVTSTRDVVFNANGTIDTNGFNSTLGGVVSGSGQLTKNGIGVLTLSGTTNTYSGGTVVNAGALQIADGGSVGTGTITLFHAAGPGFTQLVAGTSLGQTFTLSNDIVLAGGGTKVIGLNAGSSLIGYVIDGTILSAGTNLTLGGTISGTGGLAIAGNGVASIDHANTYTGFTFISNAVVRITDGGAFSNTAVILDSIGGLYADAAVSLANNLTVNTSGVIGGTDTLTINGNVGGTGTLYKIASNTLDLTSSASGFNGTFHDWQGTTLFNGSFGGGSASIDADFGGTIGGSGTIKGNVTVGNGGTLAPGNSPGTLTINGNLTLNGGSTLAYEFNQPNVAGGANNDLTKVTGNLTLDGTLNVATVNPTLADGTYAVFTYGGALTDNGLTIGTLPTLNPGGTAIVEAGLDPGYVNLIISSAGFTQYWDGGNTALWHNGVIDGGSGTMGSGVSASFTDAAGALNSSWQGHIGVFDVTPGTVTLAGPTTFEEFDFNVSGYVLAGGSLVTSTSSLVNNSGDVEFNTTITGAGEIVKTNGGTLVLDLDSSYAGGTQLQQGTIAIAASQALGTGTLTQSDGTNLQARANGLNVANNIVEAGGLGQVDPSFNTLTLSGVISGPGGLWLNGQGTLILTNANSYAGGTQIDGNGELQISSDGNLGQSGTSITFTGAGGQLTTTAGITTNRNVVLNADGAIDTQANNDTFSGVFSGSGALTKLGSGTLTLSGNSNTYTGGTNLNSGTLAIAGSSSIGTGTLTADDGTTLVAGLATHANITLANTIVLNGGLTVDLVGNFAILDSVTGAYTSNGTTLTLNGDISGTGSLTTKNFGLLTITGDNSYSGGTSLTGVEVRIGSDTALGTGTVSLDTGSGIVNNSGTAHTLVNDVVSTTFDPTFKNVLGGNSDLTLNGNISGNATLAKVGSGVLTLAGGSNSFNGVLDVNKGELRVDGAFTDSGVAVNVNATTTISGTGSIAGTVDVASGAKLNPGDGTGNVGTLTFGNLNLSPGSILNFDFGEPNVIGGGFNDRVVVTGNLTLDGTLNVSNSGAFGLGVYNVFSYGTLTDNGLTLAALPGGFSGTLQNNTAASQINLIVLSPGTLIQYWDGADEAGNGTIDGGNGTWNLSSFNWTTDAPSTLNASFQPGSMVIFQSAPGTVDITDVVKPVGLEFLTDGYVVTSSGSGTLQTDSSTFIYTETGIGTEFDATISGSGAIVKQGLGTLTLGGNNTYAGGTDLQTGEIVVTTNTALGTGQLSMSDSTTLTAGAAVTLNNLISLAGADTINTPNDLTLDGLISGAGLLDKQGGGTLTLNGANSYGGGTLLEAGTIVIGNNSALGTGTLEMGSSTALQSGVDGLTVGNAVLLDAGSQTVDTQAFGLTLTGKISGDGQLFKEGSGNLTLTSANDYTGGTQINHGSITVGNSSALGTGLLTMESATSLIAGANGLNVANSVSLAAGTETVDTGSNVLTLSGAISGDGALSKIGSGNLILSGNNSYHGGTDIVGGTLTLASNTGGGDGDITIEGGTILAAGGPDIAIDNNIHTPAGGRIDQGTGVFTLNGTIDGLGSISTIGSGNLVLNGANSFHNLGIGAGTVTLGTDTAGGVGEIVIAGGAVLAAGKSGLVIGNPLIETTGGARIDQGSDIFTINSEIAGPGSISTIGTGNLVLNGNNSFHNLGIGSGTVTLGSNTAGGVGEIVIAGGTILAAGKDGLVIGNPLIETTGGGRIDQGSGTFTINSEIAGSGSISTIGTGNLVLNGNNSFKNLGIGSGTVTLGTNTAGGIGEIVIAGGTILAAGKSGLVIGNPLIETTGGGRIDQGSGTFTINSEIAGPGSISTIGTGNLVLNGNNSFKNLGIGLGTVTLGTNTAGGIGEIVIAGGTILAAGKSGLVIGNPLIETTGGGRIDQGSGIFTINSEIAGPGSISTIGTGNLVLNGNNSFKNLGIGLGTVTLGTNTAGGSGEIVIAGGAILAAGKDGLVINNLIETTGGGRIDQGTGTFTINGQIANSGSISTIGSGNLVLNGNNSFNNLGIGSGTVTLGTNTAGGIGEIVIAGGSILAAGKSGLVINNLIETTGGARIDQGTGVFTLNGTIANSGSISTIGSGNLVLNGNNSFTNLGIGAGTVTLGTNTAAGIGEIVISGGTILAAGKSGLVIGNPLIETTGGGRIDQGTGTFTINSEIAGPGSISTIGTGNLVLNGNNSFKNLGIGLGTVTLGSNTAGGSGEIVIAGGTILAAGKDGLVINNLIETTGGGRIDQGTGTFTINGQIANSGSISTIGSGNLVLNGNNSFNNLGIGSGTVTLGSNTAGGIGEIVISGGTILAAGKSGLVINNLIETTGGGRIDQGSGTFTINGQIANSGSISTIGTGNLVLNGNNSFKNLGIGLGTVTLGTNTAGGIGEIVIAGGSILAAGKDGLVISNLIETTGGGRIDQGTGTFTINGQIANSGSISTIGTGNLVLNGNNSFTNLGIGAGTVTLGTNTAAGIGEIVIAGGSILAAGKSGLVINNLIETTGGARIDQGAGTFTINGQIANSGSISTIGSGNLVLNGNNTFNNLGIGAGTVTLGTNTAAGIGEIVIAGGSILAAGKSGLVINNLIETTGGGRIDQGTGTFTINGQIANSGSISTIGTGNLVLNGNNTFNNLGIGAGTVTLGSNTAAGIGEIVIAGGTILAAGKDGLVISNPLIETTGGGRIDQGTGTFTINSNIANAGSISTIGSGNLVLNGNNTFNNLGIGAGKVTLGSDTAGGSGEIVIAEGAILAAGKDGLVINNLIETTGGARIDQGSGTFTINGQIANSGSISTIGSGNLVLNGNNTFNNLGIGAGKVTLGSNTAGGSGEIVIAEGAILAAGKDGLVVSNPLVETTGGARIDQGTGTLTINSNIANKGSISTIGSGNLVLNGNNSFTGGLGIGAGTVTVGSNSSAGAGFIAIAGGATLAAGKTGLVLTNAIETTGAAKVDSGSGVFTLNGNIGNVGSINKLGLGNLTLNGFNTFNGLIISAGTVTLGNSNAGGIGGITLSGGGLSLNGNMTLSNPLVLSGPSTIDTGAFSITEAGGISGPGSLTKTGSGTLTLAGVGTYTGGTSILGGTLIGSATSFGTGAILDNAALVINQTVDASMANAINGTGSLTKTGGARLNLTGVSALSGPTTVAAGNLAVNGSLANSAITVQSGATLSGTGTVGAVTVLSGGTFAPGNSIGTTTVNGPLTFAPGSTYSAEVATASNDRINATGPASLAGNLNIIVTGGLYTINSSYTLVSAASRTGTFTTTSYTGSFGSSLTPTITYDATTVRLTLAPVSLAAFAPANLTPNQSNWVTAFDQGVKAGLSPTPFNPLYALGNAMGPAIDQLTGEIHSAERRVALEDTRVVRETAFDRLNDRYDNQTQTSTTANGEATTTAWLRVAGSWGSADADGNAHYFKTSQTGFLTGIDYATGPWKVGGMFHYLHNKVEMESLGSSTVESTGGAVYGGYRQGALSVGAGGSIAGVTAKSSRSVTVPGMGQSLTGRDAGKVWQLFGEVAFNLSKAEGTAIEPFGRIAYAKVDMDSFTESGGTAALYGDSQSHSLTLTTLGLRGTMQTGIAELSGSVGWQHAGGDRSPTTLLAITGSSFPAAVNAVALDENAAAIEAKANFRLTPTIKLGVGYSGVIGDRNKDHGARATLTIGF